MCYVFQVGGDMKYRLLKHLLCPACQKGAFTVESHKETIRKVWGSSFVPNAPLPEGVSFADGQEIEVEEGILHCGDCQSTFPIQEGIPRLMLDDTVEIQTSAHRYTKLDALQDLQPLSENFDELQHPLKKEDFLGRTVLDVGCGYGRHTFFAARYGAEVIAVDHSEDAVKMTKENTKNFQHVHVIQADASRLPLKEATVDRVYSFGVLHHVDNPFDIMTESHRVLASGGTFHVWVYGPRQGATLLVNNALRGMTTHMSHQQLLDFSRWIARLVRVGSHTPYLTFRHVPVGHSIVSHLPLHDHHRWPFDIVVADIYDRLRFPVTRWFKGEELQSWFIEHGYLDCHVRRIVRNNETFSAMGVKR